MTRQDAAGTWDRQVERYRAQEPLQAGALAAAARLAGPWATGAVVDLATGTGAVLRALAARRPPRRH